MRKYTIKGETHVVYDIDSEVPEDIKIAETWKKSRVGDWVRSDDGSIIQVLDTKLVGKTPVIQTCIGTYPVSGSMDTSERENRHSLNGKYFHTTYKDRVKPTQREILFAKRVVNGQSSVSAYLAVYKSKSEGYAKKRAAVLIRTRRIQKLMNDDMKDVMKRLGIDLDYLISRAKDECDNAKNPNDRISALKMLWDANGVVDKGSTTETIGMFQKIGGFQPEQLEEIKRPVLPDHQTHGDDSI